MPFRDLVALFPCHSLEDFPIRHEGAEADSLLAAWVGLSEARTRRHGPKGPELATGGPPGRRFF